MSDTSLGITLTVNGERVSERVDARKTLVDFLRELDLTGSHAGCEHGVCGACTVRVDGEIVRGCLMLAVQADGCKVETRRHLADFLRHDLRLTGTHLGCEHGVCGACTVRVNGEIVRGCLMLAAQCDGATIETIEGLADAGEIADLQSAFAQRNALQCGYCTPGMLIAAQDLLARGGVPSRAAIRDHLSGNYCRCTGYQAIVDAIEAVAQARAKRGEP